MIQATFTFSGAEFNHDLIDKIKKIFQGDDQNIEIFIRVKTKESTDAHRKRIENAAQELERGENTVLLTGNEFESLDLQI
ncbi:MAG: hypothetical protein RLZZ628_4217 [Bacteroidota bacterium]|jgi:mannose/fructose-specific phosphotransferase system component IIA